MMFQEPGDGLLKLFKTLNIETGNINPSVIKAWFDTDSENFLKWICSSITEENYIFPHENKEFLCIEEKLFGDELDNELMNIETDFPDLFHYDLNLLEIDIAEDTIEVLEEELEGYENQVRINKDLNHSLSMEFSKLTSEEMKSHIEKEAAQEACQTLAKKLDEINSKSYDQILKYHTYLRHYEFATNPEFVNKMEITEFEEQFINAVTWVNSTIKIDNNLLDTLVKKNFNTLSKIKNRLSKSFLNCLIVQMESEALHNTLKYLDKYDCNTQTPGIESDSLQLNIEYHKNQQNYMLRIIEESSLKQAEYYISQPTVKCLENKLNIYRTNLDYLNEIETKFSKLLCHLVVIYDLFLKEKVDISSSNEFFKNVMQYVQKDLQNCNLRREAMMKIIDDYKTFSAKPIEHKLKLIENFGTMFCKRSQHSLTKILEEIKSTKNQVKALEKKCFKNSFQVPKLLTNNIELLQSFLTCGPTHRIVTVSHELQTLFYDINSNLESQSSSLNMSIQILHKAKASLSEENYINHKRLLWIYFLTDFTKIISLFEELKNKTK